MNRRGTLGSGQQRPYNVITSQTGLSDGAAGLLTAPSFLFSSAGIKVGICVRRALKPFAAQDNRGNQHSSRRRAHDVAALSSMACRLSGFYRKTVRCLK